MESVYDIIWESIMHNIYEFSFSFPFGYYEKFWLSMIRNYALCIHELDNIKEYIICNKKD